MKSNSKAIVSRQVDFWMLGGASVFLFLFVALSQLVSPQGSVATKHLYNFVPLFTTLSLFVNYPHFIISYKFGYNRGKSFILKHWFSLIVVPLFLLASMVAAYIALRNPTLALNGTAILSWSLLFLSFTVSWHYLKQVFGCMMVYSRYDTYPITATQRKIILGHLYLVAAVNFVFSASHYIDPSYSVPRVHLSFPNWIYYTIYGFFVGSLFITIYFVLFRNFKEKNILPSQNFLISWIALLTWFIPPFKTLNYFLISVPFFHSLQYLPFAYRLESAKNQTSSRKFMLRGFLQIGIIFALGLFLFELVPDTLDGSFRTNQNFHVLFFLAAFNIFLNVHHYFIDSVVWRLRDPDVRDNLFSAAS